MFHKDRISKTSGGVLITANKTYLSSEVKTENNCELIFVSIPFKELKDLTVGYYRPYWTDDDYMENFTETVEDNRRQHKDHSVWQAGDINLGDINWNTHTVGPLAHSLWRTNP